jgi:hypothetical protein
LNSSIVDVLGNVDGRGHPGGPVHTKTARRKAETRNVPEDDWHNYATAAMAAGVSLFDVARLMGTSVDQINDTYRHLLPDSIERARTPLDGFLAGAVPSQVDGDGLQDRIGHQLGERGG